MDEEEEYVVSEDGRTGSWKPIQPGTAKAEAGKPKAKRKYKRRGDAAAVEASADAAQPEASAPGTSAVETGDVEPSQDDGGGMDVEDI